MNSHAQEEIERKYEADARVSLPSFADLTGLTASAPEQLELDAEYLDTADLDLASARIALRRREGGHDAGWHIKADTPSGRFENQWPLGDGIPQAVRDELAARLGGTGFDYLPLAHLHTDRTIVTLSDASGTEVVEIADDHVQAHDIRGDVRRSWREWEAELLPGAPDDRAAAEALLDRVEVALLAAGATPSYSRSKIGRALGN